MRTPLYLVSFIACLWAAQATASDTAYKCTTATGAVSFLDKKPTSGCASIELVNIADGTTVDPSQVENEEKSAQEKDKEEIAAREQKAKEECIQRGKELEALRNKPRVVITDPKTGEKRTLSPEEHQAKIGEYERYLQVVCAPPAKAAPAEEKAAATQEAAAAESEPAPTPAVDAGSPP